MLERVTEQGNLKLPPSEVIDLSLGRSFSVNEDDSYFPPSENQPSSMEFKLGRFDITVDNALANAFLPNDIDDKLGRSFITNEEE